MIANYFIPAANKLIMFAVSTEPDGVVPNSTDLLIPRIIATDRALFSESRILSGSCSGVDISSISSVLFSE